MELEQEAVWAWCDLEEEWEQDGVCCFSIGNAGVTSDEYQLRSPPFYALGVPWTLRLYKAKAVPGQDACFMAAYLDAGNALRIDPTFEQEVTFTFALRKAADQKVCLRLHRVCTIVGRSLKGLCFLFHIGDHVTHIKIFTRAANFKFTVCSDMFVLCTTAGSCDLSQGGNFHFQ